MACIGSLWRELAQGNTIFCRFVGNQIIVDMKTNYRGSEWRKWDLHVHTPGTKLNNKYSTEENIWDIYCQKIEESDVDVFGITDYFSIDNYIKFTSKFKEKHPNSCKVFFPNVEFRLGDKNKGREHMQFHIIFSNNENVVNKIPKFLMRLPLISTDNSNLTAKFCTQEDLETLGYEKAMVNLKEAISHLKENFSENDYIIVGISSGYGSLRPGKNDGKGGENAKEIDKNCGIFFGSSRDTVFYLNKKQGRESFNLPPKPVINGSDCHSFYDLDNKLGKSYTKKDNRGTTCDYSEVTWIKADPTFEGLKQIIYEPEERVRIQENNPDLDFEKPFFSSIKFNKDEQIFEDDEIKFDQLTKEIPLNPNLVAIIGGRGEGKSMLMDYISTSFYDKKNLRSENFAKSGNIEITYSKTIKKKEEVEIFPIIKNSNYALDFIYINQGELKNIVEDKQQKSKLANEISKMANIKEVAFDEKLDKDINDRLDKLHETIDFLNDPNNNIEKLKEQEIKLREFIKNVTTEENKDKLQNYSEILENTALEKERKDELTQIKQLLGQKGDELNKEINTINQNNKFNIPLIDNAFKVQIEYIEKQEQLIDQNIGELDKKKDLIKNSFNGVYTGDLSTLLKDVDKYQSDLFEIRNKIKETEDKENDRKKLTNKIFGENNKENSENNKENSDVLKIREEYEKQKEAILKDWEHFNKIDEREDLSNTQKQLMKDLLQDLSVDVVVDFNKESFYDQISNCINGSELRIKNNRKAQQNFLKISDLDSFFEYISKQYIIHYYEKGFYGYALKKTFFKQEERNKYINVYPILKYKGKDINRISVGQKGTMYLKIKLATEAFSKPIIFDQPEDDLDNEFIIKNLVGLFKELKKYRQIIIITHNANLVVNADAEQIIVAKNNTDKLSYISGSLENMNINKHICQILEGGKEAFKNRERKYGFHN